MYIYIYATPAPPQRPTGFGLSMKKHEGHVMHRVVAEDRKTSHAQLFYQRNPFVELFNTSQPLHRRGRLATSLATIAS